MLQKMYKIRFWRQKDKLAKIKMAAAAILDLEISMPFVNHLTDLLKNWQECDDMHMEHSSNIKKTFFNKNQDGGSRHLEFQRTMPIS